MIKQIEAVRKSDLIGNKARSLFSLAKNNFRIPRTMVLTDEARIYYGGDPGGLTAFLKKELGAFYDPTITYAVRSSSVLEDAADHSFAGQFKTFLNIQNLDDLIAAVKEVWKSSLLVENSEYFKKISTDQHTHGMGVIIQEMVDAAWSGVAFSINPVTGRDEIVIEGVQGRGDALVQKGENPCRWIYSQGNWEGFGEDCSPDAGALEELVEGIKKLRKKFRTEVDIEWAFDGKEMYYLQCRSITAQKYPVIYSNHISREFLPGMIKPLVWSVNIPLVNSSWIRLLEGLLGPLDISPEQLSKSFYYRAYFNMGTMGVLFKMMGMPANSLESLMGRKDPSGKSAFRPSFKTYLYLPRMIWFILSNLNLGRRFQKKVGSLGLQINEMKVKLEEDFPMDLYPRFYGQIMALCREVAYYNILIPLVMQVFNRLLKRKLEKRNLAYEELDFEVDFPGLREYDPKYMIRRSQELWENLPDEITKLPMNYSDLSDMTGSHEFQDFQNQFFTLLANFGHFSESGNDFSYPPWREDPDFLFRMVRQGHGEGNKNIANQEGSGIRKLKKKAGRAYDRAGIYRLYREMISSEYTRAYGLFRHLFLKTGEHLQLMGKILQKEDVFLLSLEEHDLLLEQGDETLVKSMKEKVRSRKQEMEDLQEIKLPSIVYGEKPPPLARTDEQTMQGIPVSPGFFDGEIIVVRGYKDFEKRVDGAILVIPFSDVGWTPVLTRASAIVSESGGMLSHASIIARELSIPAIASVDHACGLKDGQRARLDGYNGVLILEN